MDEQPKPMILVEVKVFDIDGNVVYTQPLELEDGSVGVPVLPGDSFDFKLSLNFT